MLEIVRNWNLPEGIRNSTYGLAARVFAPHPSMPTWFRAMSGYPAPESLSYRSLGPNYGYFWRICQVNYRQKLSTDRRLLSMRRWSASSQMENSLKWPVVTSSKAGALNMHLERLFGEFWTCREVYRWWNLANIGERSPNLFVDHREITIVEAFDDW